MCFCCTKSKVVPVKVEIRVPNEPEETKLVKYIENHVDPLGNRKSTSRFDPKKIGELRKLASVELDAALAAKRPLPYTQLLMRLVFCRNEIMAKQAATDLDALFFGQDHRGSKTELAGKQRILLDEYERLLKSFMDSKVMFRGRSTELDRAYSCGERPTISPLTRPNRTKPEEVPTFPKPENISPPPRLRTETPPKRTVPRIQTPSRESVEEAWDKIRAGWHELSVLSRQKGESIPEKVIYHGTLDFIKSSKEFERELCSTLDELLISSERPSDIFLFDVRGEYGHIFHVFIKDKKITILDPSPQENKKNKALDYILHSYESEHLPQQGGGITCYKFGSAETEEGGWLEKLEEKSRHKFSSKGRVPLETNPLQKGVLQKNSGLYGLMFARIMLGLRSSRQKVKEFPGSLETCLMALSYWSDKEMDLAVDRLFPNKKNRIPEYKIQITRVED